MTDPGALGLAPVVNGPRSPCSFAPHPPESMSGAEHMTDLLQKISNALDGESDHDLDQIENTLTDGYACALAIEAEQWRLEKRLSAVAHDIERGDVGEKALELSAIARRLDGNAANLAKLRSLLTELRRRANDVRVGVA